jgi:hypothetical protein
VQVYERPVCAKSARCRGGCKLGGGGPDQARLDLSPKPNAAKRVGASMRAAERACARRRPSLPLLNGCFCAFLQAFTR